MAGEQTEAAEAKENRQQRRRSRSLKRAADKEYRRLERARLRHDQWVTPAGLKPVERLRAAPQPEQDIDKSELVEPVPEPPEVQEANWWGSDKLHYDEEVLVEESELYGQFNFRDTILDQLDRYWIYLERMRKHDDDAYGFYKQVGATLVPHAMHGVYDITDSKEAFTAEQVEQWKAKIALPPSFNQHRPAFGCLVYGANSVAEHQEEKFKRVNIPRFLYFVKYKKPPPEVQPMHGGDVYKMVIWWDRAQSKKVKHGSPTEFAVFIDATGTRIHLLRMLETKMIRIQRKRKLDFFSIPARDWRIPDYYESWAAEFGLSAEVYLAGLFCDAIRWLEHTQYSMLRIAVHKGDLTAVFGLDPARMAYFFRDRDYKLTVSGHRKPVFHMTRPHIRSDGVAVKAYFSGEKEFDWAGYHVTITVPRRDHFMLNEMNIGVEDEYWRTDPKEKYITEPEFGQHLVDWMKQGVGKA